MTIAQSSNLIHIRLYIFHNKLVDLIKYYKIMKIAFFLHYYISFEYQF